MCGIVGILGNMTNAKERIRRMTAAIEHRGPDTNGVWLDESAGIGLGHVRLAIVDLSASGAQPMSSHNGRFVISFNGEIYNHEDIRLRLGDGVQWRGTSDTETLIVAVQELGLEKTLQLCVGMFAFALWDRETSILTLARDRAGEKPLYYGNQNGQWYFASELGALEADPLFEKSIDPQSVALMLNHKCVPDARSIYHTVHKLMPGHYIQIRGDKNYASSVSYWSLTAIQENQLTEHKSYTNEDAVESVHWLLDQSVRAQLMSDVPIGAFLSGGIDSSTIVALMQKNSGKPVRTFSIGFENARFNEATHAKAVADHLGTSHTELYVTEKDALDVIPRLPSIYDEPFSDASQIPTFLVSKLAKQDVTVTLSGDGGDELFGGYDRYFQALKMWKLLRVVPEPLRRSMIRSLQKLSSSTVNTASTKFAPKLSSRHEVGDKYHKLLTTIDVKTFEELYYRMFSQWHGVGPMLNPEPLMNTRLYDEDQSFGNDRFSAMMSNDFESYLPNDILTKVDRAGMSVSLETRIPMLDHRLIEHVWNMPTSLKVNSDNRKWILKEVLYKYVPRQIVDRPKMGFGVPISDWLRGPLKVWAMDTLSSEKIQRDGLLSNSIVQARLTEHMDGTRQWSESLWSLLMYQCWLDSRK